MRLLALWIVAFAGRPGVIQPYPGNAGEQIVLGKKRKEYVRPDVLEHLAQAPNFSEDRLHATTRTVETDQVDPFVQGVIDRIVRRIEAYHRNLPTCCRPVRAKLADDPLGAARSQRGYQDRNMTGQEKGLRSPGFGNLKLA